MTRQCLYCAKEIPKNSSSNFCSKECWTEYKKLKSMNIDADKQATVMLKQSEISNMEPKYETAPPVPKSRRRSPQSESGFLNLQKRVEELESIVNAIQSSAGKTSDRDSGDEIRDIISRLTKIEDKLSGIDHVIRTSGKLESRLKAVESRLEGTTSTGEHVTKKGFFARLFG